MCDALLVPTTSRATRLGAPGKSIPLPFLPSLRSGFARTLPASQDVPPADHLHARPRGSPAQASGAFIADHHPLFFPLAHRFAATWVSILRGSCDGKRRTPLCGESERVLEQSGHCTKATLLLAKRWRSMATTAANGHLGVLTVCAGAPTVPPVAVVGGSCLADTTSRTGSVPLPFPGAGDSAGGASMLGPAPSMIFSGN